MFSYEYFKIFKNTCFYKIPPVAAPNKKIPVAECNCEEKTFSQAFSLNIFFSGQLFCIVLLGQLLLLFSNLQGVKQSRNEIFGSLYYRIWTEYGDLQHPGPYQTSMTELFFDNS